MYDNGFKQTEIKCKPRIKFIEPQHEIIKCAIYINNILL